VCCTIAAAAVGEFTTGPALVILSEEKANSYLRCLQPYKSSIADQVRPYVDAGLPAVWPTNALADEVAACNTLSAELFL
jgi:hypothetical protein